jgi:hypothetical protein
VSQRSTGRALLQRGRLTYLGFIPMITSTNLTMRMFLSGRLKSRIDK